MAFPKTAKTIAASLAAVGITAASIAFGTATANAAASAPTLVDTELGALQGAAAEGVRSWLGVPYAAPPVDELRWASPEPAEPWEGVREATEFGNACAQGSAPMPGIPSIHEDCLYLNVYSPDSKRDDLPVMVWFHGGGNSYGAAEQYDPSRLVTDGKTVVVTVNYRQGVFGSFAHPALDEGGETTSGNYGLEDQQAAMRWVRENAEAFGGSGDNVTIFGESGGGFDVCAHLTSPTSEGLFDKAIMQSAPCASPWAPSREEGQDRDIAVAEQLKCTDLDEAEACLRALKPEDLNAATANVQEFQPVDGGPVMPVATADAIASGAVNDVPVLTGINRDENQLMTGGMEVLTGHVMTADEYYPALEAAFPGQADAVAAQYPLSDYENPAKALAAAQTDAYWAANLSATVDVLAEQVPTYAYEMSASSTPYFNDFQAPSWEMDAFHMVDVAFLFDTTIFAERSAEVEPLADRMVKAWSTFARTGDPDGRGRWTEADGGDRVRQLTPEGARTIDFADEHHLEFWKSLNA
ncbi:carboxylesterase/lipase family protein [Glycomyces algeriensis]|uniref:Carboxylic ester hydrolase n=1 Tax=Glycomyces algeriensis TaxID=256037 RepID=A0A9W6G6D3_9ACTN|nr:carboxylesterase family protein [Glycomyces algeriensis]MDA1367071.1 carboxylesterase family protein [Glycomyces algeriensis]MDR7348542.1 para-nitrobenzyl esterase [Glycomyces algeriensis]GLI41246.1 carboxylic ester hydrolase [Glycomyces algeriensis]